MKAPHSWEHSWDLTTLAMPDSWAMPGYVSPWDPAIVLRTTRVFQKGDLVICDYFNGQGRRAWVHGFSHRHGRMVRGYVMNYQRWRREGRTGLINRVPLRRFALPSELASLSPADSAVRAHVVRLLQAAYAD